MSDGTDLSATQPAAHPASPTPSPADETRTSEPHRTTPSAPAADIPSLAAQLRNPDRYHILGEHGRGGLGRVSRAHDRDLGRDIAIKELISRGPVSEVRFLREALVTARLEHPGIVPVYEAGRWPDGTPFYAMKLVAGRPLRELIAERTTVDERIALLHHVIAVADAIAYAHGRNIIHRDLKPANVIVGDFGETVVIDWGLAKDLTGNNEEPSNSGAARAIHDDGLTSAGVILGTPAYMAPEQERGEPVDQRADVFAIGAMLWELCSLEKLPANFTGQRQRILRRAGIDQDLVTIVEKALDPDPVRRYPDAGALAADLKAFKAGARIAARRYSLWAMLVHWIRRRRTVALSAAAAVVLALAATTLYVRNIAAEGDRADKALNVAQRERTTAQKERDRAMLSEASLLLEKDPAKAKELLASLTQRSLQYALLMTRAQQRAAVRILDFTEGIDLLSRWPGMPELALVMDGGDLYRVNPHNGTKHLEDHDLQGEVTPHAGQWLYVRKPFGARTASVHTSTRMQSFDAGELTSISTLVSLDKAVYALDTSHDLYRLSNHPPILVRHGVHNIAGSGSLLAVCSLDGVLEVMRGGTILLRRRCPRNQSPETIAVVGNDYAAMTEPGLLTTSRGGRPSEIQTEVSGEYELALSSTGLVALADYTRGGNAWLIRPNETRPESAPVHASKLLSVAAEGDFAAWGYTDGTAIVLDTSTDAVWELKGHPDGVTHMVIDSHNRIFSSSSSHQVRVWDLKPAPVTRIHPMPCRTFNSQMSPDQAYAALDCSDGSVWVWSRRSGSVTRLHQHADISFGVQWLRNMICSSGWDGRVICSTIDANFSQTFTANSGRITWLAGSPGHDFLVLASSTGGIWKLDDQIHELYSHNAIPYRVSVSPDGTFIASCGLDGSLIVFDLTKNRIAARLMAHVGAIHSIEWLHDELWTSGVDGALRQWRLAGGILELSTEIRETAPLRLTRIFTDGWVTNIHEDLLIKRSGTPAHLRLDFDKSIDSIDVSPDMRYIVAGVPGEVVIIDLHENRLASLNIDFASGSYIGFIDLHSLLISATTSLKTVQFEELDYVYF